MAALLAKIEIPGGVPGLKCPITGIDVIAPGEGFDPDSEHTPHLRFFIDWIGGIWVADPSDLPADQASYQRQLITLFENASETDDQNALITKCLEVLPKSSLVLEILNPPAPTFDGDICYACFDLSEAPSKARIRLHEAG